MKVPANAEACVAVGGCVLAVDLLTTAHEASERTAIPLQSNLIAATAFVEPQKEWHYIIKDGTQAGPLEKDAIRRAWSRQEIDWNSKCWAHGMTEWKRLRDIRELRWALSTRVAVLTPVQVCRRLRLDYLFLYSFFDMFALRSSPWNSIRSDIGLFQAFSGLVYLVLWILFVFSSLVARIE